MQWNMLVRVRAWVWVCVCVCVGVTGEAQAQGDRRELRCATTTGSGGGAGGGRGEGEVEESCKYVGGSNTTKEHEFSIDGKNIVLKHEDGRNLEVRCNGWAVLQAAALPRFSGGLRVSSVTLTACPPPAGAGSYSDALAALNVTLLTSPSQGNLTLQALPPRPPLRADHFRGLHELIDLQLLGRSCSDRPTPTAGFLNDLRSLRRLIVNCVKLPPGVLADPPTSLRFLKLKRAGVTRVPGAVLALSDLWTLELDEDMLLERFQIPLSLRKLSLNTNNNTLEVVDIPSIETLGLIRWSESRPEVLARCDALRTLKLVSPAAEMLPDRWVGLCPRLKTLTLTRSTSLKSLPPKLLENATALEELGLTRGVLETLPRGLLRDVHELRALDLSDNRLQTITSGMLEGPRGLQTLDLSSNWLTAAGLEPLALPALPALRSLTKLDLSRNPRLHNLCDHSLGYSSLLELRNLSSLYLVGTNITRICRDWRENMTALRILDLRRTQISVLRFPDMQYSRAESVTGAVVLLDGAPVASVQYSEDDYERSLRAEARARGRGRAVTLQLDERSWLQCDCRMYWSRLALFGPAAGGARPVGLRCSDGRLLGSVPPADLVCAAPDCGGLRLPRACRCSVRPAARRATLVRVRCAGAGLAAVPALPAAPRVLYDLVLPDNSISELRLGDLPPAWRELDVRNNSLTRVEGAVAQALVGAGGARRLWLAGNPLDCSCGAAPLLLALHAAGDAASDMRTALCAAPSDRGGGAPATLRDAPDAPCAPGPAPLPLWLVGTLVALFAATVAALACFADPERRVLAAILLRRWGVMPAPPEPDDDFPYDAFVSYSHEDEEVVWQLAERLERGPAPHRLCLHYRDWAPGRLISEQIAESVRSSRRTVAVLSRAFLSSAWARAEVREALRGAGDSRRLVVVLLEDPREWPLDPELRRHLATTTYLRWGDRWFWDKLFLALSTPGTRPGAAAGSGPASRRLLEPPLPVDAMGADMDRTDDVESRAAAAGARAGARSIEEMTTVQFSLGFGTS